IPDGSTTTSTNDIANPFQLNVLTLGGTGTTAPSTINVGGSALQLVNNGATAPVVNLNATAGLSYNVSNPITLAAAAAAAATFTGNGTGDFNFSGGISGSTASLTKNGVGSTMTLGGSSTLGTLTLSGGTAAANSRLVLASGASLTVGSTSARSALNIDSGFN